MYCVCNYVVRELYHLVLALRPVDRREGGIGREIMRDGVIYG